MTHSINAVRARRARGTFSSLRILGATAVLAGLSACAGSEPQIPATQEAAQYRAHAQTHYVAPGPSWDPWGPYIKEAATRFDVPETWIRAVMHQESGGQEFVVSTPGAMGLMQVMPFTFDLMRQQYDLGDDPYDPHNNLMAGTAYIRQMYDIYGSPGFLAAYNAGPGRLDDFLTRNRPLPAETRHYVANIGPQIAFDSPHNRSQADLMAMNHASGDYQVASGSSSPSTPALAHSVQLAWARRQDGTGTADNEVTDAAPIEPVHSASRVSPKSVRAIWLDRVASPSSTRGPSSIQMAAATPAPASPVFTPAPTPSQAGIRPNTETAANEAAAGPSPELADSVADAPDPAPAPQPAYATRRTRFRLVNQAIAETVPYHASSTRAATTGNWAIQVGAFGSAGAATAAAGSARNQQAGLLSRARSEVAPTHDRHGRIYRARLTGLSREAAMRACQHMGRADCMVVSPDGES